jgi:cytoskeletal protein RodZ
MSLINDALKRATRNQQTSPPAPAPEPATPMQPVEYHRRGLPWYFIPAVLAIIAAACWFIVKGVQARRQSKDPAGSPILVKAREPKAETPTSEPASTPVTQAPLTTPAGVSPTPISNGTTSTETTAATAASTPAPEPPAEPPKPAYRLQAIFFRPANPSAMVNGKSVSIGSQVDGATVKAITRDNLTIEVKGQTTVLTLTLN